MAWDHKLSRAPSLRKRRQSAIAGDMRISSVFCLKARPRTPMVLSLITRAYRRSAHEALHLLGVDLLDFTQEREIVTELLGDFDKRAQVLRETLPPKPSDA